MDQLTALLEEKHQIILNQNRARFGQSIEKRPHLLCDGQTSIFKQTEYEITEKALENSASEKKSVTVAFHTRKVKRTMEEFAANVPEEAVIMDLPDAEKYSADGRPLKYIGMGLVRSELIKESA